ncbi:hypothetical protein C8T65DRAFT_43377 [Cerioporus squamosus]|nr:hypothetical protein C8T65DRAFT_43377 [Cerioporus squamosus]
MHSNKRRRASPGFEEPSSGLASRVHVSTAARTHAHPQQDRYHQRSPASSRNGHDMRRDDASTRSRNDVDDRWRMADSGDRYSYDRRDDPRRGGDPHDTRDGDGRAGRGHNDLRLCRIRGVGHQQAVMMTVLAAMGGRRKTVALVTTTIGGTTDVGTGGTVVHCRRSGRGTRAGNRGGSRSRVGRIVGGLPIVPTPPIERIANGSPLRRGSLATMEARTQLPTRRARVRASRSRRTSQARKRRSTSISNSNSCSKNAVGATMTVN